MSLAEPVMHLIVSEGAVSHRGGKMRSENPFVNNMANLNREGIGR